MKVSEYIAQYLRDKGVTDVFGIPGGVILDLIYAFDATEGITPHLSYHEQCAGFAACGYAQASASLGVAYATKGPGFTNLLTSMADAYYDSIPVLFITAHSAKTLPQNCRTVADQDMDTCGMVRNITKFASRIDTIEDVCVALQKACHIAVDGRKGPVFLDIAAELFKKEIVEVENEKVKPNDVGQDVMLQIGREICQAKHPVLLIGDGINQTNTISLINTFIEKVRIPVLSSRYSHNVIKQPSMYYGYIGSHGIRYANFILSKADLVVSLGNRLNFPSHSLSYDKIVQQTKFLRFDIDEGELAKHPQMQKGVKVDLSLLLSSLASSDNDYGNHEEWLNLCNIVRDELWETDVNSVVLSLSELLGILPTDCIYVSDVGNNEFWVSRACVYSKQMNRTLYSKSFGALGNAIGKAIGVYYATNKPVVAFVGDQGLQMNIQELQYISNHHLPIVIVALNNHSSGMIKDREKSAGYPYCLHTTSDSGYSVPDFHQIASAYGIAYRRFDEVKRENGNLLFPLFIEMNLSDSNSLSPFLPKGRDCQDMEPSLDKVLYDRIERMLS